MASRDVTLTLTGKDDTRRATDSAADNFDRLERKLNDFNARAKRVTRRGGLDAASEFVRSFAGAITLGMRGALNLSTTLGAFGAAAGASLGALIGGALVTAIHAAIVGGLPLLIGGGLFALVFKTLVEKNKAAVKTLKGQWKTFLEFIAQPLHNPFLDSLKEAGEGLERLRAPVRNLMRAIGPALAPFTKGVMDGLVAFVEALEPAMPGIVAGMRAWAKVAPGIGKAVGDMISTIMKDPKAVESAIQGIARVIIGLAGALGAFIRVMPLLSPAFALMTGTFKGAITAAWGYVKDTGQRILNWFKRLPLLIKLALSLIPGVILIWFIAALPRVIAKAREIVTKVVAWFKKLPGWVRAAIISLPSFIIGVFAIALARAVAWARRLVLAVVAWFRRLPGMVRAALSGFAAALIGPLAGAISRAIGVVRAGIGAIQRIIDGLRGKTVTITTRISRIFRREYQTSGQPFNPGILASNDNTWMNALNGSGHRTGGPRLVLGDTNVDVRAFFDSREIAVAFRSTVADENRRSAYRARVGRR